MTFRLAGANEQVDNPTLSLTVFEISNVNEVGTNDPMLSTIKPQLKMRRFAPGIPNPSLYHNSLYIKPGKYIECQ